MDLVTKHCMYNRNKETHMQGMWVVCTTRKLCDFSYNVMTYIAGPYLEVYAERTIYYLHGGVQDVTHKKK